MYNVSQLSIYYKKKKNKLWTIKKSTSHLKKKLKKTYLNLVNVRVKEIYLNIE